MTHIGAEQLPNNTVAGGNITHVGQFFFDQDLISLVEEESPYTANTQTLLTNARDGIMAAESANVDPVVDYVFLGDSVSDGIFGWIAFGMDATSAYDVSPAVYWTEDGGVKNPNGPGGGPGGPGGPGRPPPSSSTSAATP